MTWCMIKGKDIACVLPWFTRLLSMKSKKAEPLGVQPWIFSFRFCGRRLSMGFTSAAPFYIMVTTSARRCGRPIITMKVFRAVPDNRSFLLHGLPPGEPAWTSQPRRFSCVQILWGIMRGKTSDLLENSWNKHDKYWILEISSFLFI